MAYAAVNPQIGYPVPQFGGLVADTTPVLRPGFIQAFTDNWWGFGEFMYARAAGAIRAFGLCVTTPVFDSTLQSYRYDVTEVPNTANLGRMLCVASDSMTSGEYGWFQISGLTPVNCSASVAADTTFGIAAAGQGGANSAGKQVLNARVMVAAAATVAKANCTNVSGSTVLQVPNSDGWFVGAYLSGTGVGAACIVSAISPDGRTVTMSVASTAAIAGTVTATYNNATIFYNVVHLNRPFAQGAIT
jgi:hypothetical protein